jgi:succinate-semialdehyde dehydrogenase/glutarate-semialdehyde dehydrogenase
MTVATGPGTGAVSGVPDRMMIGGQWRSAADGAELAVVDPATEATIAHVPVATDADIALALESAAQGFVDWARSDVWTRSAVLRRVAALLREQAPVVAATITAEQGKPLAEATAEVNASAEYFDWFADETRRNYGRVVEAHSRNNRILVVHQPIGPVAAFTTWNFPLLLPSRKVAAALAAGCSVVLKPAEETPRTALLLARICIEAGVEPRAINVITGDPARISTALIASDVIRKVSLTGSTAVGRTLLRQCADGVKSVSMELGGHAPVIVCDDADLDLALETCVAAKFRCTGQVCTSPSRFLVARSLAEQFARRFAEIARGLRVGPGTDPATQVGPVSSERRLTAIMGMVEDAVAHGAEVVTGGRRDSTQPRGWFFEPTVLAGVTPSMQVATTEVFGPIAPVLVYDDLDEAIAIANATPYGLAGYVFTTNVTRAFELSERLEVGVVGVNNLVVATPEAPFGGVKQSGSGREGGSEGIVDYCTVKYINMRLR